MPDSPLLKSAINLTNQVILPQGGEAVVIITDAAKLAVAQAFGRAFTRLGNEPILILMPESNQHGNEPPSPVAAAMVKADIVLTATTKAMTHTRARLAASRAGARVMILRGVDEQMMVEGSMAVDYQALRETNNRLRKIIQAGEQVRVTSGPGTEVTFSLAGRPTFSLDGFFHEDTGFAVLPPGEVPSSPKEGTTRGTIVFDYSMDGLGRLAEPLKLTVESGRVIGVAGAGQDVQTLEKLLAEDENAANIAEFAIGTNPKARLIGNLAEDKKKLGSVHFAVGDNISLGGKVESKIHLDGLMVAPTVVVDGRMIVEKGKLLLED